MKGVSHSTEGPGLGTALEEFCKLVLFQRWDIAFLGLEKANLKACGSETNGGYKLPLFCLIFGGWGASMFYFHAWSNTLQHLILGGGIICGGGGFKM